MTVKFVINNGRGKLSVTQAGSWLREGSLIVLHRTCPTSALWALDSKQKVAPGSKRGLILLRSGGRLSQDHVVAIVAAQTRGYTISAGAM